MEARSGVKGALRRAKGRRALDTTPTFQKTYREESEGKDQPIGASGSCQTGRRNCLARNFNLTSANLSLLEARNGLDNGGHRRVPDYAE
jgi:hypothetical protein